MILRRHFVVAGLSATGGALLPLAANAQAAVAAAGAVEFVVGDATISRGGASLPIQSGTQVREGDLIQTKRDAEVHVKFEDGGYLAVRADSAVRIDRYVAKGEPADTAAMTLVKGALRSVTGWIGKIGAPGQYRIQASTATVGVRGTDHEVLLVEADQATPQLAAGVHNRVNEGATTLTNTQGKIEIARGSAAFASQGQAPRAHATVPPIFNRLRTANEGRVRDHARAIQQHMTQGLRARGKLQGQETAADFLRRSRKSAQAGPGKEASGKAQRQADRRAAAEERRSKAQQERQGRRAGRKKGAGEGR